MANQSQYDKELLERKRVAALANLTGNMSRLAAVFLSNGRYGKSGEDAVEMYVYDNAMATPEANEIILGGLKKTRTNKGESGGQRYTGSIREIDILSDAHKVVTQSFSDITLEDLYVLMRIKNQVPDKYKKVFLNEFGQELKEKLFARYQQFLVDYVVAEALIKRTDSVKGGLEQIVIQDSKSEKTGIMEGK